ncbi:MAG: phosphatase PAP2 family protein [Halobacteriovoraceae bacterium]|nr:phosphatase PAP2 family protein [Halobacteriovoraceae bacterium]
MKYLLGFLLLILSSCQDETIHYNYNQIDPFKNENSTDIKDLEKKNTLKFSDTQKIKEKCQQDPNKYIPKDWKKLISIEPPPTNDSKRTRLELDYLLKLQSKRTSELIQRINVEKFFGGWKFGDFFFTELGEHGTDLGCLLYLSLWVSFKFVFHFKFEFDRVRPSFLENKIIPTINIPPHPAYPSGHATEAYILALVLSEIDPNKKKSFKNSAFEIAENRVYAGVHYPSDSAAGKILAEKIFDLLLQNEKYKILLDLGKKNYYSRNLHKKKEFPYPSGERLDSIAVKNNKQ